MFYGVICITAREKDGISTGPIKRQYYLILWFARWIILIYNRSENQHLCIARSNRERGQQRDCVKNSQEIITAVCDKNNN